jgi:hypothetical protein
VRLLPGPHQSHIGVESSAPLMHLSLSLSHTHTNSGFGGSREHAPCGPRKRPCAGLDAGVQAGDRDRNAELSNANKSFADRRVTGNPPCSSPRRRDTSTQILESTNNHEAYFNKHRTGFCLLGFISDVLTTSLAEERPSSRAEKRVQRLRPEKILSIACSANVGHNTLQRTEALSKSDRDTVHVQPKSRAYCAPSVAGSVQRLFSQSPRQCFCAYCAQAWACPTRSSLGTLWGGVILKLRADTLRFSMS